MNEFFPESNHSSYRNIAVELFKKFFDEEVLELIASQMVILVLIQQLKKSPNFLESWILHTKAGGKLCQVELSKKLQKFM